MKTTISATTSAVSVACRRAPKRTSTRCAQVTDDDQPQRDRPLRHRGEDRVRVAGEGQRARRRRRGEPDQQADPAGQESDRRDETRATGRRTRPPPAASSRRARRRPRPHTAPARPPPPRPPAPVGGECSDPQQHTGGREHARADHARHHQRGAVGGPEGSSVRAPAASRVLPRLAARFNCRPRRRFSSRATDDGVRERACKGSFPV